MRHGRVRFNPDDRLDHYEPRESRSFGNPTKGRCGCGAETNDSITVGPPGHPENGWTCKSCQEFRLRCEMEKLGIARKP